jgi:hypothetical protein
LHGSTKLDALPAESGRICLKSGLKTYMKSDPRTALNAASEEQFPEVQAPVLRERAWEQVDRSTAWSP